MRYQQSLITEAWHWHFANRVCCFSVDVVCFTAVMPRAGGEAARTVSHLKAMKYCVHADYVITDSSTG